MGLWMVLTKLPKGIEYALKLLILLCLTTGRPMTAAAAARCAGIPPSQATKTLHFLSWAGLTRSRRGPKGGYLLRQSPDTIRVAQIVNLYKPNFDEDATSQTDPLLRVWMETSSQLDSTWGQLTILELACRTANEWQIPV